jgi:hypothetical protein
MYKKTITYTDYNDMDRTEDFYFNLSEVELTDMQLSVEGGLSAMIDKLVESKDMAALINILKDIIIKSYGVKSEDGRRFIKKPEYVEEFMQTPAYGALYMELATDETAAAEFINKIIPSKLTAQVDKAKIANLTSGKPSAT